MRTKQHGIRRRRIIVLPGHYERLSGSSATLTTTENHKYLVSQPRTGDLQFVRGDMLRRDGKSESGEILTMRFHNLPGSSRSNPKNHQAFPNKGLERRNIRFQPPPWGTRCGFTTKLTEGLSRLSQ